MTTTKTKPQTIDMTPKPYARESILLRELPGAWLYRVTMSDGRELTMTVPKD